MGAVSGCCWCGGRSSDHNAQQSQSVSQSLTHSLTVSHCQSVTSSSVVVESLRCCRWLLERCVVRCSLVLLCWHLPGNNEQYSEYDDGVHSHKIIHRSVLPSNRTFSSFYPSFVLSRSIHRSFHSRQDTKQRADAGTDVKLW